MSQKSLNLTALLILTFLLLNLSCCDDCKCPTCPKEPVPGSYYVYISDSSQDPPGYIWVADSKTDSVIDSILTPDPDITAMDISPDKRFLATLAIGVDSVFIFDLETNELKIGLPVGEPLFTPDNIYLLINDIHQEMLYKYSISNWALLETYNVPIWPSYASGLFNNASYIFGSVDGKEYSIFDYEKGLIIKTDSLKRPDGSTPQFLDIIASPDDRYFYFTSRPNKIFKFEIETDSIVDSFHIAYGAYSGSLKNSPDGRYLLLTETTGWLDPPKGNLVMIDQSDFSLYRRISSYGLNPVMPGEGLLPMLFDITPDGSKAICGSYEAGLPPVSFNLFDLTASVVAGFEGQMEINDIAVGKEIR